MAYKLIKLSPSGEEAGMQSFFLALIVSFVCEVVLSRVVTWRERIRDWNSGRRDWISISTIVLMLVIPFACAWAFRSLAFLIFLIILVVIVASIGTWAFIKLVSPSDDD